MVISSPLYTQMLSLLSGYIDGLQATDAWKFRKVKNAFTPSPNLVFADVTIDPDWSLNGATWPPAWQNARNAINSNFQLVNSVAGRFDISTTATVRTVYGVVVVGSVSNTVFASAALPAPVNISAANQMTEFPPPKVEVPVSAVS